MLFALAIAQGGYDVVDRQTAAVILWWIVGLAAVVSGRLSSRPALSGVLATAFAAGISVWIAVSVGRSISEERTVIELGRSVAHLAPVVLIGWALPARLWRSVLAGLIIGAVAVCVAALGNRLSPGFLGQTTAVVFSNTTSRLAAPLGYWNAVGSWSVITTLLLLGAGAHAPRWWQRSLAMSAVPLAVTVGYLTYSRSSIGALAVGLVILVALSLRRWTLVVHAGAAVAASLVCVLAVRGAPEIADATGTAGGATVGAIVVAAGIALAVVSALTGRLGLDRVALPLRTARIATGALVIAALVFGAVGVASYGDRAWDKFSTVENFSGAADPTGRLTSLNNGSRVAQWNLAIDSWKEDKLRGSGAGTFELTYNTEAKDGQFVRDAHSAFLEALSEQGVVGFGLLVGFVLALIACVATAVRRSVDALDRGLIAGASAGLAAFLFGTGFDWFWEVTALALYAMALAGVLIAAGKTAPRSVKTPPVVTSDDGPSDAASEVPAAAERPRETRPLAAPRKAAGWPLRAALVAVAVVAILVELPGLVGTSEVRRSQSDVVAGDIVGARSHADQAIDIIPWASSPFLQRALVDEQAGEWTAAAASMKLAIERDPKDWRLPLVLSRVEAKAGRTKAALAAYRQAKALRPYGEFFR